MTKQSLDDNPRLEGADQGHQTYGEPTRPDEALPASILKVGTWDNVTLIRRRHPGGEESVSITEGATDHVLLWNPDPVAFDRQRRDGRDQEATAPAGTLNLLPAHEAFDWTWSYDGRPATSYHVCLGPDLLSRLGAEVGGLNPDRVHLRHGINFRNPAIQQCLQMMHRELSGNASGGRGGALYISSLAQVLGLNLLRAFGVEDLKASSRPGQLSRHEFGRVREYIEDNLADDVSLEDLSEVACLSTFHFTRKFKRTTGLTPHCYLVKRRVERAKQLLHDKAFADRGIAPIALACGFSDQSHMSRHFKRLTGVTPFVFRQDH
ncbi:MAG: AraC family transcriptional regulator [Planctomycetota bacterium]